MKKYVIILLMGLLSQSCQKDVINESGTSEIAIRVESLPGVTPFPDGTTYLVYSRSGPYNSRNYQFIDKVECLPTPDDPYTLTGTFEYDGDYGVTMELLNTEEPPKWDQPYGFWDPFYSQNIYFDIYEPGAHAKELYYAPNYWVKLSVYAKHWGSYYGGNGFSIGNGKQNLRVCRVNIDDRNSLSDTVTEIGAGLLGSGTDAPLYFDSADDGYVMLHYLGYNDFVVHDTTYVFYDADKDSISITN